MKVLVVEDDAEKVSAIKQVIETECGSGQCSIDVIGNLNGALVALGAGSFDIVVADLVLPQLNGAHDTVDGTDQWCQAIERIKGAKRSSWVVMTRYAHVANDARRSFAQLGVAVIEYDETGSWRRTLSAKVREQFVNPSQDFVIVCALQKEREGFLYCEAIECGERVSIVGLDCQSVRIGDLRGQIIVLPEPGMISAAIGTVKAAGIFKPRAIAMSGICGGMRDEAKLGDLIVPDVSWNYQTGKIKNGDFQHEILQVQIPPVTKAKLNQLADGSIDGEIRSGLLFRELTSCRIRTSPMVSGSMVVSDAALAAQIGSQSRKIAALDMEVAAVYSSAHDFYNGGGIYFAAKTIVDLADHAKDDRYHEYGCAVAARFCVRALKALL